MSIKFCKGCGSTDLTQTMQIFSDKSEHLRVDCACGEFNGYVKQHNGFDKLLVKDWLVNEDDDYAAIMSEAFQNLVKIDLKGKKVSIIAKVR